MPWAATSKEVEDGHHTGDKKADPDVEDGLDGHEPTKKEQRKRSHPKVQLPLSFVFFVDVQCLLGSGWPGACQQQRAAAAGWLCQAVGSRVTRACWEGAAQAQLHQGTGCSCLCEGHFGLTGASLQLTEATARQGFHALLICGCNDQAEHEPASKQQRECRHPKVPALPSGSSPFRLFRGAPRQPHAECSWEQPARCSDAEAAGLQWSMSLPGRGTQVPPRARLLMPWLCAVLPVPTE